MPSALSGGERPSCLQEPGARPVAMASAVALLIWAVGLCSHSIWLVLRKTLSYYSYYRLQHLQPLIKINCGDPSALGPFEPFSHIQSVFMESSFSSFCSPVKFIFLNSRLQISLFSSLSSLLCCNYCGTWELCSCSVSPDLEACMFGQDRCLGRPSAEGREG